MAADDIVCTICGAKNQVEADRCISCGARLDSLGARELTEEEEREQRNQQETFEWKWVFVAFGVYMVLQAIILAGLQLVIPAYDPQGLPGLLISAGVWFVGGILVGAISPGKTFVEPAVGALLAVPPTILYLSSIADVHKLSTLAYVIGGLLGVMMTLLGAFLGEKIQPSAAEQKSRA
ncbi:MAG: hypothetical protein ACODAU_12380 [Myxococcota bacterium]